MKLVNPLVPYYIKLLRSACPKSPEWYALVSCVENEYEHHTISSYEMNLIAAHSINNKMRKIRKQKKSINK